MHWSFELMRGRCVVGGGFLPVGEVDRWLLVSKHFGGDVDGLGRRMGLDFKSEGFTRL